MRTSASASGAPSRTVASRPTARANVRIERRRQVLIEQPDHYSVGPYGPGGSALGAPGGREEGAGWVAAYKAATPGRNPSPATTRAGTGRVIRTAARRR